jgi:hypothetical protein
MVRSNAMGSAARSLEPAALALVLAVASVVPVAWVLQAGTAELSIEMTGWHPLGTGQALVLAVGALAPAAILGGSIGGLVWRRRPAFGPLVALSIAWFVGIVALPLVASAAAIPLRAGIWCFDACQAALTDAAPLSGLSAYAQAVIASLIFWPLLLIPGALLLVARLVGSRLAWVAAWLSVHAWLNAWTFLGKQLPVYVILVAGVVLWTAWLWLRDAERMRFGTAPRRWLAAIAPALVLVTAGSVYAATTWIPGVPLERQEVTVGTAEAHGFNPPDPSDWLPQIVVPHTPEGSGCFAPIERPAGRLELCWEAYRDNREHLPGADYYQFRLVARLHSTGPRAWVSISVRVDGEERTSVRQHWPSGVLDGECRYTPVEGMNFLKNGEMTNDIAEDAACGRTTVATSDQGRLEWVIWTCAACGADQPGGRQIAIRHLVGTPEGAIPTWEVSAALGE